MKLRMFVRICGVQPALVCYLQRTESQHSLVASVLHGQYHPFVNEPDYWSPVAIAPSPGLWLD